MSDVWKTVYDDGRATAETFSPSWRTGWLWMATCRWWDPARYTTKVGRAATPWGARRAARRAITTVTADADRREAEAELDALNATKPQDALRASEPPPR